MSTVETRPVLGPIAKAAMRLPIEGSKRRKVLVLIAAYADAGREDPSIRELARRTEIPPNIVSAVVDRLERDGHLRVRRGAQRKHERNRYRVPQCDVAA